MCRIWLIRLLLGFGLIHAGAGFASDKPLRMTISVGAPLYFENGRGYFDQLTKEIFERLDLEYEMVWLPAQRSLVDTNGGTYDGIIARTPAIEKKLPNLVRVPVNILDFEFMAYVKNPSIRIDGWDSLDPYAVGMINGWKIVEQNTLGARSVAKVNDYRQLLTLLEKERIDVAILDRVMGGWQLKQLGFDQVAIEPPIVKKPNYVYLHKRHAALVPRMARVIDDMIDDGTLDSIYQAAMAQ